MNPFLVEDNHYFINLFQTEVASVGTFFSKICEHY